MAFCKWVPALAGICVFLSCENDIEKIRGFQNQKELPTLVSIDNKVIYTDSAKLEFIITSPLIERHTDVPEPYTEFRKGISVKNFNKNEKIMATITANYAIYYASKYLWEARNDVEIKNLEKREQLNTEQIFWDEKKGIIYSDKWTRIMNEDGVFYGNGGFEANQNFTWWKLKKVKKSSVNFKDEE
jgi:hypothetical protein